MIPMDFGLASPPSPPSATSFPPRRLSGSDLFHQTPILAWIWKSRRTSPIRRHPPKPATSLSSLQCISRSGSTRHWWDFTLDSAPVPPHPPTGLSSSHSSPKAFPSRPARKLASDRPAVGAAPRKAIDCLILVCPLFGRDGEERPSPLWDEVQAPPGKNERPRLPPKPRLPFHRPTYANGPHSPDPCPQTILDYSPGLLSDVPGEHSPSSLQTLMAVHSNGRSKRSPTRPPEIAALTNTDRLIGNLPISHRGKVFSPPGFSKKRQAAALALF